MSSPIIREIPDTYFWPSRLLSTADSQGMKDCLTGSASCESSSVLDILFTFPNGLVATFFYKLQPKGLLKQDPPSASILWSSWGLKPSQAETETTGHEPILLQMSKRLDPAPGVLTQLRLVRKLNSLRNILVTAL